MMINIIVSLVILNENTCIILKLYRKFLFIIIKIKKKLLLIFKKHVLTLKFMYIKLHIYYFCHKLFSPIIFDF